MKETTRIDYLAELEALALASRLRRLLQRLHADGERVYRSLNVEFKPKWFPALHLLSNRSPLALTEMARLMCVTHPSSIEIVDELVSAGLVKSQRSDTDGRSRELSLTRRGEETCRDLRPVWEAFRIAGAEANAEDKNDFLKALGKLEQSLDRQSMYDRIMTRLESRLGQKKRK